MKITKNKNTAPAKEIKPVIYESNVICTDSKGRELLLCLMSWFGEDKLNAKYDLRWWWYADDGERRCGKGVTLDADALASLAEFCKGIEVEDADT